MRGWLLPLVTGAILGFAILQAGGLPSALAVTGVSAPKTDWPLWNSYRARFVDAGGRVVDVDAGDRTTSEAQSYALFFSLVANDRITFDRVLRWTSDNLSKGSLAERLPGWLWGSDSNGMWRRLDVNSASDADLWTAYALVQAGRLWREPSLQALGQAVRDRAIKEEIHTIRGLGPMLLPGKTGFHEKEAVYSLNPSYLPLQVLLGLSEANPNSPLVQSAAALPLILRSSSPAGYAMDMVEYHIKSGFRAARAIGSYDAIRVYLWAGLADEKTPHRNEVLSSLRGMQAYLSSNEHPPEQVTQTGVIIGIQSGPGFAAAVLPFLDAVNDRKARDAQARFLQDQFDESAGLYGKPARYYDQNLALFALGWAEHRFRFDRNGNLCVSWSSP